MHETGITTCATNIAAATISNIDDGNQYMNHLLAWDIIEAPNLKLENGTLPIISGAGSGFILNEDNVAKAKQEFINLNQAG